MKPGTKHLDKSEACYETEYALRQDIHFRKGEIIKLEYLNASHCREIEILSEKVENLERELAIRDIPRMKESLKAGSRLAIKQDDEIERLNARITKILETTSDMVSDDQINRINGLKDLFEYLKYLLITFSQQEGNEPINPDDIDVKYIETASRYCYPALFDKYALLDQDDSIKDKVQLGGRYLAYVRSNKYSNVRIYKSTNSR